MTDNHTALLEALAGAEFSMRGQREEVLALVNGCPDPHALAAAALEFCGALLKMSEPGLADQIITRMRGAALDET